MVVAFAGARASGRPRARLRPHQHDQQRDRVRASTSGGDAFVLAVTIVALALILVWFAFDPARPGLWLAVGLLVGGALGNLADRVRDRRGDRLHRPAAVAGLQPRRHRDHPGRRADRCSPPRSPPPATRAPAEVGRERPSHGIVHVGRVARGDRQARRPRRPPGARAPRDRRSSSALGELLGGGEVRSGPGSSIGSTRTPPA